MKKIEIMKLDTKLTIDAKAEGCWSDCKKTYYDAHSAAMNKEMGEEWCEKKTKKTAKSCWIW